MQQYFQLTPPAVHDMIVKLEKRGFISREPGKPRSIRLLLTRDQLPDFNDGAESWKHAHFVTTNKM